jgi:hypothetical protein
MVWAITEDPHSATRWSDYDKPTDFFRDNGLDRLPNLDIYPEMNSLPVSALGILPRDPRTLPSPVEEGPGAGSAPGVPLRGLLWALIITIAVSCFIAGTVGAILTVIRGGL